MKSQEAREAVDKAIDTMKSSPVGDFKSPMGRGIVIKSKPEYDYDGDRTDHHHFLTHGPDGKALSMPQHFVMTTRSKTKNKDKPAGAANG